MKKYLPYILIILISVGFFSPMVKVNAQPAEQNTGGVCFLISEGKQVQIRYTQTTCNTRTTQHEWLSDAQIAAGRKPNVGGNTTTFTPVGTSETQGSPDPKYHLLAPLPCPIGSTGCDSKGQFTVFDPTSDASGKNTKLSEYLNLMIKIFIGLCAVLAVVMIVIGGMEYMTSELISSKEAGKERIRGALLGLILALGAYVLLFTINPNLLITDVTIDPAIIAVEIAENDAVPQTYDPVTKKYKNGILNGTPLTGTIPPPCAKVGDTGCRPAFITLNTTECTTAGQQNCTSTRGLNMSKVQTIQWGCGCSLVITGGTEFWLHGGKTGSTTHQNGGTTVDLRPNQQLNTFLVGNKPLIANTWYQSPVGEVLYEVHGRVIHWHVGG